MRFWRGREEEVFLLSLFMSARRTHARKRRRFSRGANECKEIKDNRVFRAKRYYFSFCPRRRGHRDDMMAVRRHCRHALGERGAFWVFRARAPPSAFSMPRAACARARRRAPRDAVRCARKAPRVEASAKAKREEALSNAAISRMRLCASMPAPMRSPDDILPADGVRRAGGARVCCRFHDDIMTPARSPIYEIQIDIAKTATHSHWNGHWAFRLLSGHHTLRSSFLSQYHTNHAVVSR